MFMGFLKYKFYFAYLNYLLLLRRNVLEYSLQPRTVSQLFIIVYLENRNKIIS